MGPFAQSSDHLLAELERIDLMIRSRVAELRRVQSEDENFRGLYISEQEIDALLTRPIGRPQWLQPIGSSLLCGQHGEHTRPRARRSRVDAFDPRMRVGRAQHDGMRQALESKIIEIAALAGKEAQILPALGPIADNRTDRHRRISNFG